MSYKDMPDSLHFDIDDACKLGDTLQQDVAKVQHCIRIGDKDQYDAAEEHMLVTLYEFQNACKQTLSQAD